MSPIHQFTLDFILQFDIILLSNSFQSKFLKMKKLLPVLTILFALTAWTFTINDTWKNKVDTQLLTKASPHAKVDFIIQLNQQADVRAAKHFKTKEEKANYVFQQLKNTAHQSQATLVNFLKVKNADFKPFYIINAIYAKGDLTLIQQIAERPEVAFILDNPVVKIEEPFKNNEVEDRGPNALEWGIERINADDVWAMGYMGQGAVVAGADTGVEWIHPAIQSKYRGWDNMLDTADHNYNWHDAIIEINPLNDTINDPALNPCGLDTIIPCDDHNHGTHTVGTMIGEDGENQIGVAPGASWIACRNMERGYGSPATYIDCFEFFLAPTDSDGENPDPTKAPHVINNSWSCPEMEGCNPNNWATMEMVVNNLKASGVFVTVSAGNSGSQGCGSVQTPAAMFENSFTVGAIAINDTITGFSSRGPVIIDSSNRMKPNVAAPGAGVRSCIRNGAYASWNGTSMAGPHVAGLVALVISAAPELAGQVDVLEDIVEQSAVQKVNDNCGSTGEEAIPNNVYGFGRIDALAAVEMALNITSTNEANLLEEVKVFPNPFSNQLSFEFEGWQGLTVLEVFDANGRLLQAEKWELKHFEKKEVEMRNYPAGVYFYKIKSEERVMQGKVIRALEK